MILQFHSMDTNQSQNQSQRPFRTKTEAKSKVRRPSKLITTIHSIYYTSHAGQEGLPNNKEDTNNQSFTKRKTTPHHKNNLDRWSNPFQTYPSFSDNTCTAKPNAILPKSSFYSKRKQSSPSWEYLMTLSRKHSVNTSAIIVQKQRN